MTKPFVLLLASLAGMAALSVAPKTTLADDVSKHGPIPWTTSLPNALKVSAKTGKPVMVDFWAEWCGPCKMMLATTWKDKSVVQRSKQFVPVLINVDDQKSVSRQYWVESIPTLLFLDAKGRIINSSVGAVPPARVLALMDDARRKMKR